MPEPEYRIVATPSLRVVTKGARVTYRLERTGCGSVPKEHYDWGLVYDPNNRTFFDNKDRRGPCGPSEWTFDWDDEGCHAITCKVRSSFNTPAKLIVEYQQIVYPLQHAYELHPALPLTAEDPEAVLDACTRKLALVSVLEKEVELTPEANERHKKQKSAQEAFCQRLRDRLRTTQNLRRHHVFAEYLDAKTQQRMPIRLFLAEVERGRKWRLVDWTNPTVQAMTGDYSGEGPTSEEAIRDAFHQWDDDNRYPEGRIRYRADVPNLGTIAGEFDTDGRTEWGYVSNVFEKAALGAAVVAGVVTLLAPVPGSQVISALIWANIFMGTTAAVINLAERHAEGFGSASADALDVLTIMGNMLGGTGMVARVWRQGATVSVRAATTVLRGALIGQVATDSIQGVIVGVKSVDEIAKIRGNATLTPTEKFDQIAKVLAAATVTGVLYYVNFKGTKKDLQSLSTAPASEVEALSKKINELSDPQAEVDISSSSPSSSQSSSPAAATSDAPQGSPHASPGPHSSASPHSSSPTVTSAAPHSSSPTDTSAAPQSSSVTDSSAAPHSSSPTDSSAAPQSSSAPEMSAAPQSSSAPDTSAAPHSSSSPDSPAAASLPSSAESQSSSAAPQSSSAAPPAVHDAPEVKGHTDQKKHTTVVQTEPDTETPHTGGRPRAKVLATVTERFRAAVGEAHFEKLMAEVPKLREKLGDALKEISDNELAAVHGYTTDWSKLEFGNQKDYQRINKALRSHSADEIAFLQDYIDLLKSGLSKLPGYEGDVFRTLNKMDVEKLRGQFAPGKLWRDDGFMSTAHSQPVNLDGKPAQVVLMFNNTKSGHIIDSVSAFPGEREILFPPGAEFEVTTFREAPDGRFFITLKEVNP